MHFMQLPLQASRNISARSIKRSKLSYSYIKVTGCLCVSLSVCLYRRISLTAEPIWLLFIMYLPISPGKVYSYLGAGYIHPHQRNRPQKKINPNHNQAKIENRNESTSPTPIAPRDLLGAQALLYLYYAARFICLCIKIQLFTKLI